MGNTGHCLLVAYTGAMLHNLPRTIVGVFLTVVLWGGFGAHGFVPQLLCAVVGFGASYAIFAVIRSRKPAEPPAE
jgi:hypothetical protein